MFRTTKCSSSARLVHAVLWYFLSIKHILPSTGLLIWTHESITIKLHVQVMEFMVFFEYQAHPAIDRTAYMDA
jgi:hypothetical protein